MDSTKKHLLTVVEFAQYEGISVSTVKRRVQDGSLPITKLKGKSGYIKNHVVNFIHYVNLNIQAQERFLIDRKLIPKKKVKLDTGDPQYLCLTPKQRIRLDESSQVVKIFLEALQGLPSGRKTVFTRQFAKVHGMSDSKLKRICDEYIKSGFDGLIPKWSCGTQRRKLESDKEATDFIRGIYMVELGPSMLETYQRYCEKFRDKRDDLFSKTTVAAFIKRTYTESEHLLARNPDEFKKRHGAWVARDWNEVEINACWFGDAKQIDVACLDNKKIIFPWYTTFMDSKSRKFVGGVLTASPDKRAIAQAFDYAIEAHGVPKVIYIDRGRPYKSYMISGGKVKPGKVFNLFEHIENERFIGIFRALGCEVFFAYPRNAKEKIIEANFGIFTDRLRSLPGYRGHNTKHRPLKLEREIRQGKVLSFDELYAEVKKVIDERNARPHSTTHRVPNAYYEGFIPVVPSESFRAFLKMDRHWVKIRNSGVKIGGDFYRGEQLWRHSGEEVEACRDPNDLREAAIIKGDELLGIAHLEPIGHYRSEITLENRKTVAKINRQVVKERRRLIAHEEVDIDPRKAAMEMSEEIKLKRREVRPPSNVTSINKQERLARQTVEGLKKQPEIDFEKESIEREVAVANKPSIWNRYMSALAKKRTEEETPKPRLRLIPRERLTMYDDED